MKMNRHARQARLAEVGAAGQAQISRAVVVIALDGWAADVAARYLAGAGVAAIRVRCEEFADGARAIAPDIVVVIDPAIEAPFPVSSASSDEIAPVAGSVAAAVPDPHAVDLFDPAARELARGALAALGALRAALASDP